MISNGIIGECIEDICEIMQVQISVCDNDGNVVAGSLALDVEMKERMEAFLDNSEDNHQIDDCHFFKVYDGEEAAYVVIVKADDTNGYGAGKLAVRQLGRLVDAYSEKFSRNQFIQNLLLDTMVGADVFNQSKVLGIEESALRIVFLVETKEGQDEVVLEMIRELYGKNHYDFVTAVNEKNIILVKEMRVESVENDRATDLKEAAESIANMLVDMINVETMSKVRVGYSNPVANLKDVSKAYREAKMAVEVGKIFYSDKTIVAYNMLGIGRLIYQLPPELCDMFLEEVFGGVESEKFDEETLATINKFFELNLNLSETARQMYVHRNTLAYRLERIEKMTGLDIRSFEDAMTFKLALMVADYRNRR